MILLICVVVVILLATFIIFLIASNSIKNMSFDKRISLKESIDLTGLPIITLKNNGRNLNFLLDTGSNDSYLDSSILDSVDYTKLNGCNTVIGATGDTNAYAISVKLTYKENLFEDTFYCFDLSKPFSEIKKEDGIQVHGILGTKFFEKYKYVLNFDELALYIK